MIDKAFLDIHYSNILLNNKDKLLSGGTIDRELINAANDQRMALVVLIRISADVSNMITDVIKEIRKLEPDMYYYPDSDFHITVMDILKGELNRPIPDNLDDYKECIQNCVEKISPFNIEFDGLTASDGAVMVRGYYDIELQNLRMMLREAFNNNSLELQERYETVSSHMTIARVREKLHDPETLLSYINKGHYFGAMKVDSIELSFHNWYDTKKTTLAIFKL